MFRETQSTQTSFEWNNSPFGLVHPGNACRRPVHPIVPQNETHIALVPSCESMDCSQSAKADHVGESGYVAFITWDTDCLESEKGTMEKCTIYVPIFTHKYPIGHS